MCSEPGLSEKYPALCKDAKNDSMINSPKAAASKEMGAMSPDAQPKAKSQPGTVTKQEAPQSSTSESNVQEQKTNIHGFITLLDVYMGICQVNESMARDSGIDAIVNDARSCKEKNRGHLAKDYPKFLKEMQNKKPSAVSKFKDLFTSWWGIMGAMPRLTLTKRDLQLEQQKDKRIFQEKKAAFETEFLF
jgi:hypothetical protein